MNFKLQRQITVAIENQPGRLAAISQALAASGINIKDLSILDNIEQGVIRMVTNDPAACKALLTEQGFHPVEAEVAGRGSGGHARQTRACSPTRSRTAA